MELELDRTQLSGFETVLDTTVCHEETLEAIVPDACPDILRVCETEGTVFLKNKETSEGRAECAGTVRAVLLYLPDGEEGLRRMEVSLPFTCGADSGAVDGRCAMVAAPRLQAIETRLLNPRKVLVKAQLLVQIQVCAPRSDSLCTGVAEPEAVGVEQMCETWETCIVTCVQEKSFPFSDDVSLPGSKPEAEEVLRSRAALRCTESKVIGNKLIFKGEAQLQVLYRTVEGGLCTAEFELPFSQIMEVSGAGEEAACDVQVVLSSLDCAAEGGGRSIQVSMDLLAQAVVRDTRSVRLLTDLYSTAYDLSAELKPCTLERLLDDGEKEQMVREILETGALAREVLDAWTAVGTVAQTREGERLSLTAEVTVTVLYQTEEGGRASASRTFRVACPLDLPQEAACSCRCSCPAPVFAAPTAGGIEVRFPVRFHYVAREGRKVVSVSAVRLDEEAPRDRSQQPSIVLRMVAPGERLWDIAKCYGTTARDILQANALEEDALPAGQLLLIPRSR